jgi:hypothetical protein
MIGILSSSLTTLIWVRNEPLTKQVSFLEWRIARTTHVCLHTSPPCECAGLGHIDCVRYHIILRAGGRHRRLELPLWH